MKKLFVLPVFLLISCSSSQVRNVSSEPAAPMKIIDAHMHFHSVQTKTPQQPSAEMKKVFAAANIVGAVVHLGEHEADTLQLDRKSTSVKFAVCAGLIPGEATPAKVEKGLKDGKYQCMKVYLGYYPKWAYDPYYLPFYKLAQKYDVPVVFHTGDTYDKMAKVKYANPLQIDEVAVTYPKVNFVIAHMGNPWFDDAAEVVYKNDNVSCDISALMLGDISKESQDSVDELVVKPLHWFYLYVENPKKLMFGTDWPLLEIVPYVEAVKKAIPKEAWEDVFYNNAARVFKLK